MYKNQVISIHLLLISIDLSSSQIHLPFIYLHLSSLQIMINPHHLVLKSDYQWKEIKAIKYEFEKAIASGANMDDVIHPKFQIYTHFSYLWTFFFWNFDNNFRLEVVLIGLMS